MVADFADSRGRECIIRSRCYGHCAALINCRSESKRSMTTYIQLSNAGIRRPGNGPLSIYGRPVERPLRTTTSGPVTGGSELAYFASSVREPSTPCSSLSAWAPKPITVNHRPRQFFARACNRDGVINPANSLERSLRGPQDVAMLGGVVALERVDDNVFH